MAGPDIKNIELLPEPIPDGGPPAPEPDTKNLDALLASMNGSAERFQTLWFSFLGLTLYLAIAALATIHRNLLLGEQQVLPILNIKVELLPFYVIAPLLYLVFHFYVLMMLALLARTAGEFDKQLRTTLPGKPEQERYRALVGNALFLQLLVGMKGERAGVNALLMGLIALITIVLAPLATLVLMQMMFLPYHHLRITWWHRGVVVADVVLIVAMTYRCFFPRGVRKAPLVLGALSRKPRWATAMAFCVLQVLALVPLIDWLSFQQGRWAGEPKTSSFREWEQWMAGEPPSFPKSHPDYSATEKGVVFGLFPDRLKLGDETIVGKEKWEKTQAEIASRDSFVPTIKFDERDLQAADLGREDLRGVSLNDAALEGADLNNARLDRAHLTGADMRDVDIDNANLRGAVMSGIRLLGANLQGAQLQGAWLEKADLQGADLSVAALQGVYLRYARLRGASLFRTNLQGANLYSAQLQGAWLEEAELQGAALDDAQLQGADLGGAYLQGAGLGGADLSDAAFDETLVFRTDIRDANFSTVSIRSVAGGMVTHDDFGETKPLTQTDVDEWIAAATQFGPRRDGDMSFARLKSGYQTTEQDASDQARWGELAKQSLLLDPDGLQHRRRLADRLGDLACSAEGAPYVARSLIRWSPAHARLSALGDQLEGVRKRMKEGHEEPETCPGVIGFTEADWQALDAIPPTQASPTGR
jgi:uncharacterized protein YjbI with pentapeptide repeats